MKNPFRRRRGANVKPAPLYHYPGIPGFESFATRDQIIDSLVRSWLNDPSVTPYMDSYGRQRVRENIARTVDHVLHVLAAPYTFSLGAGPAITYDLQSANGRAVYWADNHSWTTY